MKKTWIALVLAAATALVVVAQERTRQRPEPTFDELTAYLTLNEAQLGCLQDNKDGLHEALAPSMEQMRDLVRQAREARRNGGDTAALQTQIQDLRTSTGETRTSFVNSAQGCLNPDQVAAVGNLIAAEALMHEVRQGAGLLLLEPTSGPGRSFFGRGGAQGAQKRGPNRQRRRGPRGEGDE